MRITDEPAKSETAAPAADTAVVETPSSDATAGVPAEASVAFVPGTVKVDRTLRLPSITFCMAAHDQSGRVFCGGSDFGLHHFDPAAEKPETAALSESRHSSYVTGLVNAGGTLISGSYDKSLIWWNAETGEQIRRIESAHTRWIRRLALNSAGTKLASVGDDMQTRVWDTTSGECLLTMEGYDLKTPHGYPSMLYAVAFSTDGKLIATGDRTGQVLIRDASSGDTVQKVETPVMYTWDPRARRHSIGGIRSVAFSADGSLVAVGGMGSVGNIDHLQGNSRIEVFRLDTGERVHEIEDSKYKGLVEQMQFSADNKWLVAAGGDHGGFLSVWSMETGKLLAQEKVGNHIHDFTLLSEQSIVTVGHDHASMVTLAAAEPTTEPETTTS